MLSECSLNSRFFGRAGGQRAREHHRGGVGWAALKHWEDRDHGATSLPRGGGVKKTPQRVEAEGNGVV